LEQSEQLLRGAEHLGHATRPLDLFYGLSQAGRAIAAAWSPPQFGSGTSQDRAWRLSSHGIRVSDSSLGDPLEDIVLCNQVAEPLPAQSHKPLPAFPALARTLGSDSLLQPVAFAELWAALPEATERPAPGARSRWSSLSLEWDESAYAIGVWVGPVPAEMIPTWAIGFEDSQSAEVLAALRGHYPRMLRSEDPIVASQHSWAPGLRRVWLQWTSPTSYKATPERLRGLAAFVRSDFEARLPSYRGRPWAFPLLREQELHPVVIWWAVLYTMSMLARYEPESWARAIDVNNSDWAVPLEHILDQALPALPEVIYEALAEPPKAKHGFPLPRTGPSA
jgi:hypothetical protein